MKGFAPEPVYLDSPPADGLRLETQGDIHQIERARRAALLLQQGVPILDVVHQTGYYDQAHLTRSMQRFVGQTPPGLLGGGNNCRFYTISSPPRQLACGRDTESRHDYSH